MEWVKYIFNCIGMTILFYNLHLIILKDVFLTPNPGITFATIGGILDFFIYSGPSPKDVIRQHYATIGLPFMPPYFSLG